jgi:hypothetical protein
VEVERRATTSGGAALFWSLTSSGHDALLQLRTLKISPPAKQ